MGAYSWALARWEMAYPKPRVSRDISRVSSSTLHRSCRMVPYGSTFQITHPAEEAVAQQPNWGPPPCLPHTLADPEEAPSSRASLSFTGAGSVTIENSSSSAEADISTISSPSSPVRRMS